MERSVSSHDPALPIAGDIYDWPLADAFLDRRAELAVLESWWSGDDRTPMNLYGRRRVGKSWLFRRFAHGKPAAILVAHRVHTGAQLDAFAQYLEPLVGVRPALPDVASLFRVLLRTARDRRLLVVIDEFPWLLPGTESGNEQVLSEIQAVLEEETDRSQLKLVVCGSLVGQMESLQGVRSPLHGRLRPLQLRPLAYPEARPFLADLDAIERLERYAVAGGMPRYLAELGRGTLRDVVCRHVLDRNGALWNEARTVLEQELREPKVYFALLSQLANGDKELGEITSRARLTASQASKYLSVLEEMRIVRRRLPVLSTREARGGQWHLDDAFFRFWFRFVFPYQDDLENGLHPADLFRGEVRPALADHVAPVFEDWARDFVRKRFGSRASSVGAWWGPSLHHLRRAGERTTEEIDIVGVGRGSVTVVGEAKWQERMLDVSILPRLREYKLPALAQAGFKLAKDLDIVLLARRGYTAGLHRAASVDPHLHLIDVATDLADESTPE